MKKIAIIGISCLFPEAKTPQEFYQNLLDEKDSISSATKAQMGVEPTTYYHKKKGIQDRYYNLKGGYINDFKFEAEGFHLSTQELIHLDDLHKWSLYVAKEALADAGYLGQKKALERCGLLLGNLSFPTKSSNKRFLPLYNQLLEKNLQNIPKLENLSLMDNQAKDGLNFDDSCPEKLVCRALTLSGPSFTLDAACATSLYAIKLACDYLNDKRADLMLAGAVSAGDPFFIKMGFSTFQAFPENGISAPFDQASKGLFAGEGAGLLLLKRYEDAVADGDQIHACISGIGLSNDGSGKFILNPDSKGQIKAFERAYNGCEVTPADVSYLECHATGTPVGDKVELESIEKFFYQSGTKPLLGSVKSNIGHLLTAAGMSSIIKIILSMAHKNIPATIKISSPLTSPQRKIKSSDFVRKSQPWPSSTSILYAAVNSFGFGGTNAHLILEKEEVITPPAKDPQKRKKSPLAIIGMEANFGKIHNLREFEQIIHQGKIQKTTIPPGRWKGLESQLNSGNITQFQGSFPTEGAFMDKFQFDFFRYKIPPAEDDPLLIQQLLMLDVASLALENARVVSGSNTAVIIAMTRDNSIHQMRGRIELEQLISQALKDSDIQLSQELKSKLIATAKNSLQNQVGINQFTSFIGNLIASRISSRWNFSGPSFTLNSGENSAYQALEIAQMMLTNNEVGTVIVGGVDLAGNMEEFLEPAIEEGFKGEGAGALVLTKLQDAKKQSCYAVLDDLSNSPHTDQNGLTNLLKSSGKSAEEIGYLELSGSNCWDSAQISAFANFFPRQNSVALGCVHHLIGHCKIASGIASVIKTALCLDHRYLPGTAFKQQELKIESPSLYQLPYSKTWLSEDGQSKRFALVSGVDQAGAVAHVLLSESRQTGRLPLITSTRREHTLFIINDTSEKHLIVRLQKLKKDIEINGDLQQLAAQYYKTSKITDKDYTIAIIGNSKQKLSLEIDSALTKLPACIQNGVEWKTPIGSYFSPKPLGKTGKVALVFPGAFTSYLGMESELFHIFPQLFDLIPSYTTNPETMFCDRLIHPRAWQNITHETLKKLEYDLLNNTPAMFESGINSTILNTSVLRDIFSLRVDAAFGYSMGEVSMLFALKVWASTDEMSYKVHNNPLFRERLAGQMKLAREAWGIPDWDKKKQTPIWLAYSLKLPVEQVATAVEKEERVFQIIINTAEESVIAGYPTDCQRVIAKLNCPFMAVHIGDIVHCKLVRAEYDQVKNLNTLPVHLIPDIDLYTTTSGQKIEQVTSEQLGKNIAEMYCKKADFSALVKNTYRDGVSIFVEMGPRGACGGMIESILKDKDFTTVTLHKKGGNQYHNILRAMAKLSSHRIPLDLSALFIDPILTKNSSKNLIKELPLGGINTVQSIQTTGSKLKFEAVTKKTLFNEQDISEFATGSITKCFGTRYNIYQGRQSPRTPNGDLQLISRVIELHGTPGEHKKTSSLISEFDLPANAWYYQQNTYPTLPYSILMEIALQPCGFLSTYMGCTLIYPDVDLNFRNLDSTAKLYKIPNLRGRTVTATSKLINTVASAQTIIVIFDYALSIDGEIFYEGNTCFGYFSNNALKEQVGLDKGLEILPWHKQQNLNLADLCEYDFNLKKHQQKFYNAKPEQPYFKLAGGQLDYLARVTLVKNGGEYGLGYIYAEKDIDPESWFFPCHFYKDPVMPGSLGVEAMLQSIRTFALEEGLGAGFRSPHFECATGQTIWKYRGQMIPTNKLMYLETHIKNIKNQGEQIVIKGDSSLWRDGIRIYEVKDLAVAIKEA